MWKYKENYAKRCWEVYKEGEESFFVHDKPTCERLKAILERIPTTRVGVATWTVSKGYAHPERARMIGAYVANEDGRVITTMGQVEDYLNDFESKIVKLLADKHRLKLALENRRIHIPVGVG